MFRDLPWSDRPPRADNASTVTSTEEGRAFFQERLTVFGLGMFVLAGGSWLLLGLAYWFGTDSQLDEHAPFSLGGFLHLINALFAGGLWWTTRQKPLPGPLLHTLDSGAALGLVALWGLTGASLPFGSGDFIALLAFTLGTLARAIVVPSTARKTLLIGLSGAAILVLFSVLRAGPWGGALGALIVNSCWALPATAVATFASHTIFGLRREIQRARVLGQYTLETKIGTGGMGDVWRASHALLRRPTAIKLLPPGRLDEKGIQRFEREVQLTARLRHPNTVAIYDYGRTRDGVFYYAMELLDGIDLEQLVQQQGAQPAERVVRILIQVCGALAEAHDLGLVHRDIKPANVLLCPRRNEHEFAKLVDFGLVKTIDAGSDGALTGINTLAGTPLYMSPEAIQRPEAVDARSDLYSLGALAWFLLVGRPPFEANTIVEICGHHLHTAPRRPSVALRASVPSDLEDIVLGCLEKLPEERPVDARSIRRQLEACELPQAWTEERAISWWQSWQQTPASHPPTSDAPAAESRTLDLDVSGRAAEAPAPR